MLYTKDDLIKAIGMAQEKQEVNCLGEIDKYTQDEIIASLSPIDESKEIKQLKKDKDILIDALGTAKQYVYSQKALKSINKSLNKVTNF